MAVFDGNVFENQPNDFHATGPGINSIPTRHTAITPSDSANLPFVCRAIHIGAAGDLCVVMAGENPGEYTSHIYKGLAAGTLFIGLVRRVMATGTTAQSLIGVA